MTPIKSSAAIRPEWVATYRYATGSLMADRFGTAIHQMSADRLGGIIGSSKAAWDNGEREILSFKSGYDENGPVKICTKHMIRPCGLCDAVPAERKLAEGWERCKVAGKSNRYAIHRWFCHDGQCEPLRTPAIYQGKRHLGACESCAESMGVFANTAKVEPVAAKPWKAPQDVPYAPAYTFACSNNESKISSLPDKFGTARNKLERDNVHLRPRWR